MKRYLLVVLDEEKGAEAEIGKLEKKDGDEDLIPDVMLREINDKVLEEGLPVFNVIERITFKTVVEDAISLLQRAQEIEEDQ